MKSVLLLAAVGMIYFVACKKEPCTSADGFVTAADNATGCYTVKNYHDTIDPHYGPNGNGSFAVDMDNDGIVDFNFTSNFSHSATGSYWTNFAIYCGNNNAEFVADTNDCVLEFNGNTIDANYTWKNTSSYIFTMGHYTVPGYTDYYYTSWQTGTGYVGVRLKKGSAYKYGWIKVNKPSFAIVSSLIEN